MKRMGLFIGFLLAALFCLNGWLWAGTTGKLVGRVLDKNSGDKLPGANVVITMRWTEEQAGGLDQPLGTATDADGEYFILNIPAGIYTVEFRMMGYNTVQIQKVNINPDLTTRLNMELDETTLNVAKTVTVVAEKELIRKDITASQTVNNSDQIGVMPVTNIQQVMLTNTGAISSPTGLHLRGGREAQEVYLIDGIDVTDTYNGGQSMDISTDAVSTMSTMTGGFNAEYGKAMSGVINIVTKEGSEEYHGKASFDTDKFGDASEHVWNEYNGKFNLSGPIPLTKKVTFALTYDFLNTDTYRNISTNPITKRKFDFGLFDNDSRFNGKLTFNLLKSVKLNVAYIGQQNDVKPYTNSNKPIHKDYSGQWELKRDLVYLDIIHTLSPSTFYELKLSNLKDEQIYYFKYKNPSDYANFADPPFFINSSLDSVPGWNSSYEYNAWIYDSTLGTLYHADNNYNKLNIDKRAVKFDYTSQIQKYNLVKFGVEYIQYKMSELYVGGAFDLGMPENKSIDSIKYHSAYCDYEYEPIDFAAYIQDKIEYQDLIVNLGVRYEYRDSKGFYFPDVKNTSVWAKAKGKGFVSPRLAFSFPVTDKAVLRFSYGVFYQFPEWEKYYRMHNYKKGDATATHTLGMGNLWDMIIGNGDLDPQKTINYEVGFNIALTNELALGVVAYYKDFYDLVATKHMVIVPYNYTRVYNADYGNSKGIELNLEQRYGRFFTGKLSYTFSRAEGNAAEWDTHFEEAYNESIFGIIPPKNNTTMEWDQPHTFSAILDFRKPENWGVNLLISYGSGLPYTPTDARGKAIGENYSERLPWTGSIDLSANKDFKLFNRYVVRLYMLGNNITDRKNLRMVFTDTGLPDQTLGTGVSDEAKHRPDYYLARRQIKLGLSVIF